MEYTNPEIPEGINTSREHPLKEFAILSIGVLGGLLAVVLVLSFLADKLAYKIPFRVEQRLTKDWFQGESTSPQMEAYLNGLAARMMKAQDFPDDMQVQVHYDKGDTVNAFATLGGHIVLYRGLLKRLNNENAVAMVLAHEIAHVRHRDPIRSIGRGVVVGVAVSMVSTAVGDSMVDSLLGQGGQLTALKYSRGQESEADKLASNTLIALYGHLNGATDLFEALQQVKHGKEGVEFFSTHPLTEKRIERIHAREATIAQEGNSEVTPLPADFSSWLEE